MLIASEPVVDEHDEPDTLPPGPNHDLGRSGEHKRVPGARERLATLPDLDEDFEHHDTIPAPPWLDEPLDAPKPAS